MLLKHSVITFFKTGSAFEQKLNQKQKNSRRTKCTQAPVDELALVVASLITGRLPSKGKDKSKGWGYKVVVVGGGGGHLEWGGGVKNGP